METSSEESKDDLPLPSSHMDLSLPLKLPTTPQYPPTETLTTPSTPKVESLLPPLPSLPLSSISSIEPSESSGSESSSSSLSTSAFSSNPTPPLSSSSFPSLQASLLSRQLGQFAQGVVPASFFGQPLDQKGQVDYWPASTMREPSSINNLFTQLTSQNPLPPLVDYGQLAQQQPAGPQSSQQSPMRLHSDALLASQIYSLAAKVRNVNGITLGSVAGSNIGSSGSNTPSPAPTSMTPIPPMTPLTPITITPGSSGGGGVGVGSSQQILSSATSAAAAAAVAAASQQATQAQQSGTGGSSQGLVTLGSTVPPSPQQLQKFYLQSLQQNPALFLNQTLVRPPSLNYVQVPAVPSVPQAYAKPSSSKPFKCDFEGCGQTLRTRFSLKRHTKKHTGEKPHKCTFAGCNSQFAETTALKRHYRIHTGEKPYKCRYRSCGKAFADATNVKRHEMTHTGEKPFQCGYVGCGRCFSRRSSLKVHLTSLHNITRTNPLFTASLGSSP